MIITYISGISNGEEFEYVHQASIICAKNNKPIPNLKVYINSSVKGNEKIGYSNFCIENGGVNLYRGLIYEDGAANLPELTSATSPVAGYYKYTSSVALGQLTEAGLNNNSYDFTLGNYALYKTRMKNKYDSYTITYNITDSTHFYNPDNGSKYNRRPDLESDSPVRLNNYYKINYDKPTSGEWPSPVMLRTDDGTIIKFSDTSSFTKIIYWAECTGKVTPVYNLIPKKTYYYKVYKNNTALTGIYGSTSTNYGVITTEGLVRMIKCENIRNVRDCGGWETVDELRVKYGLLYRGALLNILFRTPGLAINSTADKKTFSQLKIGKEIDLREYDYSGKGTYGDSTFMTKIDSSGTTTNVGYKMIATENNPTLLGYGSVSSAQFNDFLATLTGVSEDNTMYIHCLLGRDRTGTYLALLFALLGVQDDGIIKDYELTSFWGNGTYRYEFCRWEETGNSNVKWTNHNTWNSINSDSGSVREKALKWFKNNYAGELDSLYTAGKTWTNGNSSTNALKAQDIIAWLKEIFLEPVEKKTLNQN